VTLGPAYLSKKLSYLLPTKGGEVLLTIQDAQNYLLELPAHRQTRHHWQHACQGGGYGGSARAKNVSVRPFLGRRWALG
jgi:hypothetical protein